MHHWLESYLPKDFFDLVEVNENLNGLVDPICELSEEIEELINKGARKSLTRLTKLGGDREDLMELFLSECARTRASV
jgi:hypothetical protein